ncbi:MAG: TonB-dependent receptor [Lewinellaceae bacterium]|nr:TonB-dependent receptor [Saprospiraceae bacterium]MCB9338711.1 TonB-dependent receptor [Lewinellaceae bacterium]
MHQALETDQKALEINLDDRIYGAFAEIGAGQEVARYFFQVGAAAGTIAKTMSAYDKVVSDDIYGTEPSGRYVCESRLYKMLDHEWELMEKRLRPLRPDTNFFVFADTVAALNYQRTILGDGWLGIRFQLKPGGEPNDLVLHVKMLDNDTQLQQQAVGILGVNLIYACFRYHQEPETMVLSLLDSLQDRAMVDMVRLTGPDFENLDNRLLSLWLVKHGLSQVAMFGPNRQNVHASEFLYKKHIAVVRAGFRPPTLMHMDMIKSGFDQFRKEDGVDAAKSALLVELTMDNLCGVGELDEKDFLDRSDLLCALGQTVVVSSCEKYQELITYLSDYKFQSLGFIVQTRRIMDFLADKYYRNMDGRLLAAFGEVFTRNTRMYAYPFHQEGSEELMTTQNLPVPEGFKYLYQHLLDNRQLADVSGYDKNVLHIFAKEVLELIRQGEPGWEGLVPKKVETLVKEKFLFGYPTEKMEFEY